MKAAVLVIDMLNDFVIGPLALEQAKEIIPGIRSLLEVARRAKLPIVYTNDAHVPAVDRELKLWGPHALAGTVGAEVVPELKPEQGDYIIRKRRYSAFFETDLDLLLQELEVKKLILVGVATDVCIQHTAADAFFRGYDVVVVRDCVGATSREANESSLEYMRKMYGASIRSLSEVLEELSR